MPQLLIIDDSVEIHKLMKFWLKKDNFEIISAFDGQSGFKQAVKVVPDVILIDVIMPDTDGFEVCKRLKSNADLKKIPIIIITASYLNVVEKKSSLKAECILLKPYELKDLLSNVKKYISS